MPRTLADYLLPLAVFAIAGGCELADEPDDILDDDLEYEAAGLCGNTLAVAGVTASGADAPTPASSAIDGSLATRWSSKGIGQWITADLGQVKDVCQVGVAWYSGDTGRISHFEISVSVDNVTFTPVLAGDSSGTTLAIEGYKLPTTQSARYVRLTVLGNTVNTWASVTELEVRAPAPPPDTVLAASGPAQGTTQTATTASFSFSTTATGASFQCRLNGSAWAACTSPRALSGLTLRVHDFEVRAVNAAGVADPTPARRTWTVVSAVPGQVEPGPDNTGVPAGTTLTRRDGDIIVTVAGTQLDALDIHGSVEIRAANVRITRCIIRGGYSSDTQSTSAKPIVFNYTPTASLVIEDSELVPEYPSIWLDGLRGLNFVARRLDIHGTTDGIGINGIGTTNAVNARVESSWIHDLRHVSPTPPNYPQSDHQTHNDGIQYHYGNGADIIGNRISDAHNAAIMVSQSKSGTWDLEIHQNWFHHGTCTINLYHGGSSFASLPPAGRTPGFVMTGNRFGRDSLGGGGGCPIYKSDPVQVTLSGNVYLDNGAIVPVIRNGG